MGVESNDPGRVDLGLVFEMNGGTLPSFIDVGGRRLVLISQAEYDELVAARSKVLRSAIEGEPQAPAEPPAPVNLSTIERDPEVAAFLRREFRGGVTLEQLQAECRERFGESRTPSANRIARYRVALIGPRGKRRVTQHGDIK